MATYQTYQAGPMVAGAGGLREDLLDIIVNISPTETPMLSGFKKSRTFIKAPTMGVFGMTFPIVSKEIFDVFTIQGINENKLKNKRFTFPGKININCANKLVLAAILPIGMEDVAGELVSFREAKNEGVFINNLDKGWYKRAIKLSDKETKRFERVIRYSSNVFKVEAKAEVNNTKVVISAIVKRIKTGKSKTWTTYILRLNKG